MSSGVKGGQLRVKVCRFSSEMLGLRVRLKVTTSASNGGIKNEGLFHGDGTCRALPGEPEDDLPKAVGQGNTRLHHLHQKILQTVIPSPLS